MSQKKKTLIKFDQSFLWRKDIQYNSPWITKFLCKLMLQGKKYMIETYITNTFKSLKFKYRKLPGPLLLEQIQKFRPVLSFVRKRMGRRHNPIPIPVRYRRQYLLSIKYIVTFIKKSVDRNLDDRLMTALSTLFDTKRNSLTRTIAADVSFLAEARFYSHLRWK